MRIMGEWEGGLNEGEWKIEFDIGCHLVFNPRENKVTAFSLIFFAYFFK